jgi:hypothetical protein
MPRVARSLRKSSSSGERRGAPLPLELSTPADPDANTLMTREENELSKGQRRSNRELKKPKFAKIKLAISTSTIADIRPNRRPGPEEK